MFYRITLAFLTLYCSLSVAYITWIEKRFPLEGTPSPPGSPWPYPQEWNLLGTNFTLDPNGFYMDGNQPKCNILSNALERYREYIFKDKDWSPDKDLSKVNGLKVQVKNDSCGYPQFGDDEAYKLTVAEESLIEANTIWGALRGIETFSQLVYQDEQSKSYRINKASISDWPSYAYRGILLDTARHFQPMKILKENLDAMAFNKFNVFHWHIVDDQSFPYESSTHANLSQLGAYTPKHVYTKKDVEEIIEYARLRGIRVLPEIDTPGHTMGFGKAFPDLLTVCYSDGKPLTPNYTPGKEHSEREILNPIQDYTYDFFYEFFQEIRGLFKDDFIHLGMDEVYKGCWESNPNISDFMKEKGWTKISQVEQYYVNRTLANVQEIGYKYMTWQDPIEEGVEMAESSMIVVWKNTSLDEKFDLWTNYIKEIAKKPQKYRMVLAAPWYLNYINYGPSWRKYYEINPRGFEGTDDAKNRVVGGEATMWGEYVDGTNVIPRIWPFASAVAERLWSDPSVNNSDDAQYRLDEQRCRMLRRGIAAQPILNGYCGAWELLEEKQVKGGSTSYSSALTTVIFAAFLLILVRP